MCPFTATFHSFYLTMYTCMTCILQSESFRKYRDLKRHSFKMSKRHVYETYMLKTFRCSLEGKPLIGFMRINNNITGKKRQIVENCSVLQPLRIQIQKERKDPPCIERCLVHVNGCTCVRGCVSARVPVFFNTHIRIFFLDRPSKRYLWKICDPMVKDDETGSERKNETDTSGIRFPLFSFIVRRCNVCMAKRVI